MGKRKAKNVNNNPKKPKKDYGSEWKTSNELYEKYYKEQGIMSEEEFPEFLKALQRELPITFRLNTACPFYETLKQRLKGEFQYPGVVLKLEDEEIKPPFPISWYPNDCAWQINCPKRKLRKIPELAVFHKWLIGESEIGTITRQEAVSMIPPLMLQVEDTDKILDMCAAPGSKTSQLLESLYKNTMDPKGMIIANDADAKRAYLLVHQTSRISCSSLCITTYTAQNFPSLYSNKDIPKLLESKSEIIGKDGVMNIEDIDNMNHENHLPGIFDRILCDVPCSGDGTLRKAPEIWEKWNVTYGNNLHPLQLLILTRGCQLLKVGGRIVYSTCSLNPIEDEAVVYSLLKRCKGAMKLVDMKDYLPELKRRSGLKSWKVMSSKMEIMNDYDSIPNKEKRRFRPTMFPPPKDVNEFPLELCMRFLPHDQDTGGFFVAVLEKVSELPTPEEMKEILPLTNISENPPLLASEMKGVKQKQICRWYYKTGECKYGDRCRFLHIIEGSDDVLTKPESDDKIVDEDDDKETKEFEKAKVNEDKTEDKKEDGDNKIEVEEEEEENEDDKEEKKSVMQIEKERLKPIDPELIPEFKDFYGIDDSFDFSLLYCRSDQVKTITYVSPTIKDYCLESKGAKKLKIVTTGMRLFERNKRGTCVYRLCQDALSIIRPHISKRIYKINLKDFTILLQQRQDCPRLDTLSEETQKTFSDVSVGSVVYELNESDIMKISEGDEIVGNVLKKLSVAGWRGKEKMSALLSEYDANSYLAILQKGNVDFELGKEKTLTKPIVKTE